MKRKMITMILCSVLALNTGVISVFADTFGGSKGLDGHTKDQITAENKQGDANLQINDGNVTADLNGNKVNNDNKKDTDTKKNTDTDSKPVNKDKEGEKGKPGSDPYTEQVPGPNEIIKGDSGEDWHITEGWVWSLSEWGKRSDWWKGKNADKDPWSKVGLSNKDIRIK